MDELNIKIKSKYFSKEDNKFHIEKYSVNPLFQDQDDEIYEDFISFYEALNHDLKNANLLHYDFKGIDLGKVNLFGAKVSSEIMKKTNKYVPSIELLINNQKYLSDHKYSKSLVEENLKQEYGQITLSDSYESGDHAIMYISDMHINHKLIKKFDNSSVNIYEMIEYIDEIIEQLTSSELGYILKRKIIIVGDLSYNFSIFRIFIRRLVKKTYSKIFFVMGNHELWDTKLNSKRLGIDWIISEYKKFLKENHVILLENQLYIEFGDGREDILPSNNILNMTKEDAEKIFRKTNYAIFGGLGYAGKNDEFNCKQGIYRLSLSDRNEEIERSKITEAIHDKLRDIVPTSKTIFFVTHMPKKDWSSDEYVKNWYYISGHTHQNIYEDSNEKKYFADNQIGYDNSSFGYKYLFISPKYNYFEKFEDGIHKISKKDYIEYYLGLKIHFTCNRDFEELLLLKNKNTYCFIAKNYGGKLYLMNGGIITRLKKLSIEEIFEYLPQYASSIKNVLLEYTNYQNKIAKKIMEIGGEGKIHGCIINIDFYSHIYINPLDGKITYYYSENFGEMNVYENLESLLACKVPKLLENYKRSINYNQKENAIMKIKINRKSKKTFDTRIYKISRLIKGLQYTSLYNTIRVLNEDRPKIDGQAILEMTIREEIDE